MSIAPDFFYDLTPKGNCSTYQNDIFESEFLPPLKEVSSKQKELSISHTHSTPILPETPQIRNFSNRENQNLCNLDPNKKLSRSSDRFRFTITKEKKSLTSPVSLSSSRKFCITRVPKNSSCTYSSEENEMPDDDGIYITIDHTKPQTSSEIINLF